MFSSSSSSSLFYFILQSEINFWAKCSNWKDKLRGEQDGLGGDLEPNKYHESNGIHNIKRIQNRFI